MRRGRRTAAPRDSRQTRATNRRPISSAWRWGSSCSPACCRFRGAGSWPCSWPRRSARRSAIARRRWAAGSSPRWPRRRVDRRLAGDLRLRPRQQPAGRPLLRLAGTARSIRRAKDHLGTTVKAIPDHLLLGTGVGSFAKSIPCIPKRPLERALRVYATPKTAICRLPWKTGLSALP